MTACSGLQRVNERLVGRGQASVVTDVEHVHVARRSGALDSTSAVNRRPPNIGGDEVIEGAVAQDECDGAGVLVRWRTVPWWSSR